MNKLLHAGILRYFKSSVLWFSVVATTLLAVVAGNKAREIYLSEYLVLAEWLIMAILFSLIVGKEFGDGTFRNKIAAGHSKGSVYISEIFLGVMACVLLFMIFSVIFSAFNGYIFYRVPLDVLIKIFLSYLFQNIAFAVVFITISCLITNKAVVAIANIILVLGLMYAGNGLRSMLIISEYDFYHEENIESENNVAEENTFIWDNMVLGIIYEVIPTAQSIENIHLIEEEFGYAYDKNHINPIAQQFANENSVDNEFYLTDIEEKLLNRRLIFEPVLIVFVSVIGCVLFLRKDFK